MGRLLLIEDNEHMRRIYSEKFRCEGFDVTTATDGAQGLEAAHATHPDAILLDLMLPRLNGFDFLKHLRADRDLEHIPVFILSNKSWPDDVQHALSLGARQFYAKGSTSLLEIVRQLRLECGFKKVVLVTRNQPAAQNLLAALQHPQLIGSITTLLGEAYSAIERGTPDAVILDARPPGESVASVLHQLKTSAATKTIPVIAITTQPQTLFRADETVDPEHLAAELRAIVLRRLALAEIPASLATAR